MDFLTLLKNKIVRTRNVELLSGDQEDVILMFFKEWDLQKEREGLLFGFYLVTVSLIVVVWVSPEVSVPVTVTV